MSISLQLHAFVPESVANGPGRRAVVWVQGCTLGCPGCFNPLTHPVDGGESVGVDHLLRQIAERGDRTEGVTVSGGEPLQQMEPLLALLQGARGLGLSTLVFTGYSLAEAQRLPGFSEVMAHLDLLIAGRYVETRRVARGLLGSGNQTAHFLSQRYGPADLIAAPDREILIGPDGTAVITGIDPPVKEGQEGEHVSLHTDADPHQ